MGTYTISNFVEIQNRGFDYRLPMNVVNSIRALHSQLKGNPEQVKQISFKKIANFHSSTIIKKEDKENVVLAARLLLNKITNKTFLECLDKMRNIIEQITNVEELKNIAEVVFDISATNRFCSKMYADLYSTLISTHPAFMDYYNFKYSAYFETFETIEYVDPSVNYEQFCANNAANEKRKALSLFFSNLMQNGVAPPEHVETLLQTLLTKIETFISTPDKINEVDEMIENLACLYHKPTHLVRFGEDLNRLSKLKHKQCASLSSKSMFKLQDIAK